MMSSFRILIVSCRSRVEDVEKIDELLRAKYFRRVQAAVDPDDGLAIARELSCLIVGQAVGERQPRLMSL